jgi:hypothetical protein
VRDESLLEKLCYILWSALRSSNFCIVIHGINTFQLKYHVVCLSVVFMHSRFIKNPTEMNPSIWRWFYHIRPKLWTNVRLKKSVGHCPIVLDIVRLGVSSISKLKVGPCPGHVRHCVLEGLWKTLRLGVSSISKLKVGPCPGHVRHCVLEGLWKTRFSPKIRPFLPNVDSWVIGHQIGWNIDTRVTSTQGTSFRKRFFSNPKISLPILYELKNLGFGGTKRNPWNQRG